MKRRVSLHPLARAEADAQLDWYLDRSSEAAAGFITEPNRLIETIADNPSSYPPYEEATRRALLRRFPLALIFTYSETSVRIIAVAHTRRRPGYWKGRS